MNFITQKEKLEHDIATTEKDIESGQLSQKEKIESRLLALRMDIARFEKANTENEGTRDLHSLHEKYKTLEKLAVSKYNIEVNSLQEHILGGQEAKEHPVQGEEKKGFFGSIKQSLKQYNQGIEKGLTSPDKKTRYKAYGKMALQGVGLAAAGFAIYKAYKGTRNRFRGLFGLKTNKEKNKNSKPRYKKTRAKVLGILGLAAVVTWNGESMKDRLGGLFSPEDAEKKKDQLGKTLAKKLGSGWSYSTNTMHYGGQSWTLEYLQEQNVIKPDASNKELGYDIDSSVSALQKFVQNPDNSNLDGQESSRVDKTQSAPEVKKHHNSYDKLSSIINTHYASKKYKLGDATASYEQLNDGTLSPGLLIAHLDRSNMYNTNAILKEGVLGSFIKKSKKHGERSWLFAVPQEMLVDILRKLKAPVNMIDNLTNSQSIAETNQQLNAIIEKLDDKTPESVKKERDMMIAKQSMVITYLLDVKETYRQLSGGSEEDMSIFNKPLHELIALSETNLHLQQAFSEPNMHEGLLDEYQNIESDRSNTLKKLEQANTDSQKEKIVDHMFSEIKDVGSIGWSTAFDTLRGHLTESDAYIDMNILDQVYAETFSTWIDRISVLKEKKGKLTPDDVDDLKGLINDFYDTMKAIKTQSHVMQETDENGDLYTRWHIPVYKAGKKTIQTYTISKDKNGGTNMTALAVGTFAAADIITKIPRNILFSKKSLKGKVLRISPARYITKNTLALGYTYLGGKHLTDVVKDRQTRLINRKMSNRGYLGKRYLKHLYTSPDDIIHALKKGHISLNMASQIIDNRAGNDTLNRLTQSQDTKDLYRDFRITHTKQEKRTSGKKNLTHKRHSKIKQILLTKTYEDRIDKKYMQTLAQYFDHPQLKKALYDIDKAEKILPILHQQGNEQEKITKALKLTNIKNHMEKITHLTDKIEYHSLTSKEKIHKLATQLQSELTKKGITPKQEQQIRAKYDKLLADISSPKSNKNTLGLINSEVSLMRHIKQLKTPERILLYKNNPVAKRIIDANGGLSLIKGSKRGRTINVGVHLTTLVIHGGNSALEGKGPQHTRGEVKDISMGMVPVFGGLYDGYTAAFTGKNPRNGRELSTSERWIRGGVGIGTAVLDVFTRGAGGTAIRAAGKVGARAITKTATKTLGKEAAESLIKNGSKVFSIGSKAAQTMSPVAKYAGTTITIGGMTLLTVQGASLIQHTMHNDTQKHEPINT